MTAKHVTPLGWPIGWARARHRKESSFSYRGRWGVPVSEALIGVEAELARLGAKEIVISTDLPIGRSGQFRGDVAVVDTGAAVYFRIGDGQRVIANDKWTRVGDNLRAIAKHIEAIRGQARWGCGSIEQALGGYKLLTALDAPRIWYEVLGLPPSAAWADVERRRGELLAKHHPDRGGSHDQAAEVNQAFENARRAFSEAVAS